MNVKLIFSIVTSVFIGLTSAYVVDTLEDRKVIDSVVSRCEKTEEIKDTKSQTKAHGVEKNARKQGGKKDITCGGSYNDKYFKRPRTENVLNSHTNTENDILAEKKSASRAKTSSPMSKVFAGQTEQSTPIDNCGSTTKTPIPSHEPPEYPYDSVENPALELPLLDGDYEIPVYDGGVHNIPLPAFPESQ